MPKRKTKFYTTDEDVRSQISHYTNVSKVDSDPSKSIELCLEVEMDDEVRSIIKCPEKCQSALLDVTVIKPNGMDNYVTQRQTLRTEEVRKLITAMNLSNEKKKALIKKLFGRNNIPKELKCQNVQSGKTKCSASTRSKRMHKKSSLKFDQGDTVGVTDETNSAVYSLYDQKLPSKHEVNPHQQIYTTPKTYENIKRMFACTNSEKLHNDNSKPDEPCLCQNCAIVGILTDSQKKPFATEPMPQLMQSKETKYRGPLGKKSVNFKHSNEIPSTSRGHDECRAIFDALSARIIALEKRINMQEERAVPKDYFKKIITKLVNHMTKLTHYTTEDKQSGYSHRHNKDPHLYNQYKPNDKHNRYYANAAFVDNTFKVPAEKEYEPIRCTLSEPPRSPSEGIWKWGEDFLTSGRDFKNRVVLLLEETLQNLRKGWERGEKKERNDDLQSLFNDLSVSLRKEVQNTDTTNRANEHDTSKETRQPKPSLIPRLKNRKGPSVNVAYVNPQVRRWPEESTASFRLDSTDCETRREKMNGTRKEAHKANFLKILEQTNTRDRYRLWQSIYNRAIMNHTNKKDKIVVQIPDPKDRRKIIPMEFTLEEVEKLLTSFKDANR